MRRHLTSRASGLTRFTTRLNHKAVQPTALLVNLKGLEERLGAHTRECKSPGYAAEHSAGKNDSVSKPISDQAHLWWPFWVPDLSVQGEERTEQCRAEYELTGYQPQTKLTLRRKVETQGVTQIVLDVAECFPCPLIPIYLPLLSSWLW